MELDWREVSTAYFGSIQPNGLLDPGTAPYSPVPAPYLPLTCPLPAPYLPLVLPLTAPYRPLTLTGLYTNATGTYDLGVAMAAATCIHPSHREFGVTSGRVVYI